MVLDIQVTSNLEGEMFEIEETAQNRAPTKTSLIYT